MFAIVPRGIIAAAQIARTTKAAQVAIKVLTNPVVRSAGGVIVAGVAIDLVIDTVTGREAIKGTLEDMAARRIEKKRIKDANRVRDNIAKDAILNPPPPNKKGAVAVAVVPDPPTNKLPLRKRAWRSIKKGVRAAFRFVYGSLKYVTFSVVRTILAFPVIIGFVVAMAISAVILLVSVIVAAIMIPLAPEKTASVLLRFYDVLRWTNKILYGYTYTAMDWFDLGYLDVLKSRSERAQHSSHAAFFQSFINKAFAKVDEQTQASMVKNEMKDFDEDYAQSLRDAIPVRPLVKVAAKTPEATKSEPPESLVKPSINGSTSTPPANQRSPRGKKPNPNVRPGK